MIDIRIPKEIRNYKEKIYAGLNLRQLICVGLAICINVPLYWYGRKILGDDLASWLVMVTAVPLMSIGFIKYNGMSFEELLIAILNFELLTPQKRKYRVKNIYEILDNYILNEELEKSRSKTRKKVKGGIKIEFWKK